MPLTRRLINNGNGPLTALSGGKSKIKGATDSASGGATSWCTGRLSPSVLTWQKGASLGLFYQGNSLIHEGSVLTTCSPPKGPSSKCHHGVVRLQGMDWRGDVNMRSTRGALAMRGQRREAAGLAWDSGEPGKATHCGHVAAPKAVRREVLPGQLAQNASSPTLCGKR